MVLTPLVPAIPVDESGAAADANGLPVLLKSQRYLRQATFWKGLTKKNFSTTGQLLRS